jgi:hypothetical protein
MNDQPGRCCPLNYRYDSSTFRRTRDFSCDVLYVVGGLYGNAHALETVLAMFDAEKGDKRLVFNGDFNWFDIQPALFEKINTTVLGFDAIRGNVETELSSEFSGAGCGCGYPAWVEDLVVERSNEIMEQLRQTASSFPALLTRILALPMELRVDVGDARLAIVHGDAESLSGWGFAQEALSDTAHTVAVSRWFTNANVEGFISSHTCLPVYNRINMRDASACFVANNGAAGMPNFRGELQGLLTRVALTPYHGEHSRFSFRQEALHIDALEIPYSQSQWQVQFLDQWPPDSAAYQSYWERICKGPNFYPHQAFRA